MVCLGEGYNPCLLLVFDPGKEDSLEHNEEKTGEEEAILEADEIPEHVETRKKQSRQAEKTGRSTSKSQRTRHRQEPDAMMG